MGGELQDSFRWRYTMGMDPNNPDLADLAPLPTVKQIVGKVAKAITPGKGKPAPGKDVAKPGR